MLKMNVCAVLGWFLSLLCVCRATGQELERTTVSYYSGATEFQGYIFKPKGNGPFPAIIWNHGHKERLLKSGPVSEYQAIAKVFVDDGYVFFLPDRHLHVISDDEYSESLQQRLRDAPDAGDTKDQKFSEFLDVNARDVAAAVRWLKRKPYVKADRIALSGWGSGAFTSLVCATRNPDLQACVLFSPGVAQWTQNAELRRRLSEAASTCKVPVFLIQAKNDPTLQPSEVLGEELRKRSQNRVEIFPFNGDSGKQRTSLAIEGWSTWGFDVLTFLEPLMKPQ